MKIFTCSACKHVAFFENSQCVRCGHLLAYLMDQGVVSALEPVPGTAESPADAEPRYDALAPEAAGRRYRLCRNYTTHAVCNWVIPEGDPNAYCLACRLNEVIPDLSQPSALDSWRGMEIAKRRLLYTLLELGLPVQTRHDQPDTGLAFAFKSDGPDGQKVLTGHCDGLVTVNLEEADSPVREQTRIQLGEPYRTLLGHFRHESGHYYWDRLLRAGPQLEAFRALFGDERADYAEAVQRHYASPVQNWAEEYVSAYATMHPWEDWAETWAHYLHTVDTLETAQSYGLALRPAAIGGAQTEPVATRLVHLENFDDLIAAWVPLTVALNSLNRSMGLQDLYPFVLAQRVVDKLRFVHEVVAHAARTVQGSPAERARLPRAPGPAPAVNPA